jgi:hypothetical protein
VILAGDVFTGTRGPAWARSTFPTRRIVYVPGNHEYYGTTVDGEDERLAAECRGLGTTLWTDLALFGDSTIGAILIKDRMSDYRRIRVDPGDVLFRPIDGMALHARARGWLEDDEGPR